MSFWKKAQAAAWLILIGLVSLVLILLAAHLTAGCGGVR